MPTPSARGCRWVAFHILNSRPILSTGRPFRLRPENAAATSCSATAIVDIDLDLILGISYNEEHIHEPDTFVQFVKALEEDEIAKGLEDVNIRAETLYKNLQENILISEAGEKGLSYLKNLTSFSKILYRKRIQMGLLERKSKEQRKMKFY